MIVKIVGTKERKKELASNTIVLFIFKFEAILIYLQSTGKV